MNTCEDWTESEFHLTIYPSSFNITMSTSDKTAYITGSHCSQAYSSSQSLQLNLGWSSSFSLCGGRWLVLRYPVRLIIVWLGLFKRNACEFKSTLFLFFFVFGKHRVFLLSDAAVSVKHAGGWKKIRDKTGQAQKTQPLSPCFIGTKPATAVSCCSACICQAPFRLAFLLSKAACWFSLFSDPLAEQQMAIFSTTKICSLFWGCFQDWPVQRGPLRSSFPLSVLP